MNKKSQFITLGIIITILLIGILLASENKLEQKYSLVNYVGDLSTNLAYNIKSTNPNCNVDNINIHKQNIIYFASIDEVIVQDFNIDLNCD